jgi:hypothetical protein
MSDCKYPHRVTIALTEEAYQKLKKELFINKMMGDIAPDMKNAILWNIVNDIENPTKRSGFPIFLDTTDLKQRRRTIVPCKECHEHPCTCKMDGKDPHFDV